MLMRSWSPRKRLTAAAVTIAVLIVFITISSLEHRSQDAIVKLRLPSFVKPDNKQVIEQELEQQAEHPIEHEIVRNATPHDLLVPSYLKAILDPDDKQFDRLQCSAPVPKRYEYLQVNHSDQKLGNGQIRYFFALNLRQCITILPRLMSSIVEAVRFLGPQNCALSIVEGNSDDGTLEILAALSKDLNSLGIKYYFQNSGIDPRQGDRIEGLAALRNQALEPLFNNTSQNLPNAAVIFLNDVAICVNDILELIHQHVYQEADMVCAMDWNDIEPAPIFYDIWIGRTVTGDTFWEIPLDGGWRLAPDLFWNHATSRERYEAHKAFQVFACWNGAVVFSAKPIIEKHIRFRKSKQDECYAGEPRLFCKDLWMAGHSRIAVVPSVNLAYSDESATKVKALHGYVFKVAEGEHESDTALKIEWDTKPPDQVKCMSNFEDQSWVAWNQSFEAVHS